MIYTIYCITNKILNHSNKSMKNFEETNCNKRKNITNDDEDIVKKFKMFPYLKNKSILNLRDYYINNIVESEFEDLSEEINDVHNKEVHDKIIDVSSNIVDGIKSINNLFDIFHHLEIKLQYNINISNKKSFETSIINVEEYLDSIQLKSSNKQKLIYSILDMLSNTSNNCCTIICGKKSSGKTVFVNILKKLFAKYDILYCDETDENISNTLLEIEQISDKSHLPYFDNLYRTNMAKLKKDNSGMKSAPMKKQTSDKNKVELKYRSTAMKNKKSFKPATESVTKGLPIGPKAVPMPKSNIGLKSKGNNTNTTLKFRVD